jgi:hypothetical protein
VIIYIDSYLEPLKGILVNNYLFEHKLIDQKIFVDINLVFSHFETQIQQLGLNAVEQKVQLTY